MRGRSNYTKEGLPQLRAHDDVDDGIEDTCDHLLQHLVSKEKDGVGFEQPTPVYGVERCNDDEPDSTSDPEEDRQLKRFRPEFQPGFFFNV